MKIVGVGGVDVIVVDGGVVVGVGVGSVDVVGVGGGG